MSDELVKRLREVVGMQVGAGFAERHQAADRIEALEAALLAAEELAKTVDTWADHDGECGYGVVADDLIAALAAYRAAVEGKA